MFQLAGPYHLVPLLALPRQGDPRGSAAGIDPQLYRRHGFFDPVLEDDREGFPAIDRRLTLPQEHPRPGRCAGAQWFLVGVHYENALQNLSFKLGGRFPVRLRGFPR